MTCGSHGTLADTLPWPEQNGKSRKECDPYAKKSGSWVIRKKCRQLDRLVQNPSIDQASREGKEASSEDRIGLTCGCTGEKVSF